MAVTKTKVADGEYRPRINCSPRPSWSLSSAKQILLHVVLPGIGRICGFLLPNRHGRQGAGPHMYVLAERVKLLKTPRACALALQEREIPPEQSAGTGYVVRAIEKVKLIEDDVRTSDEASSFRTSGATGRFWCGDQCRLRRPFIDGWSRFLPEQTPSSDRGYTSSIRRGRRRRPPRGRRTGRRPPIVWNESLHKAARRWPRFLSARCCGRGDDKVLPG